MSNKPIYRASLMSVSKPLDSGKSFNLCEDETVESKMVGYYSEGNYRAIDFNSVEELVEVIESASASDVLLAGVNDADSAKIVSNANKKSGQLSRSNGDFPHTARPGILVLDNDIGDMSEEEALECLHAVAPVLQSHSKVICSSTSAGIFKSSGEELKGYGKWHIVVPIEDCTDIERALNALHIRLWNAGYGRVVVSEGGRLLERSPVDRAMKAHSQPMYLRAHLSAGLVQKKIVRAIKGLLGDVPFNTRQAVPDISAEELAAYLKAVADAKADPLLIEQSVTVARANAELLAEQDLKRARSLGKELTLEQAIENRMRILMSDISEPIDLPPETILFLGNGRGVTVAEVLDNPADFHGVTCCDPSEPSYHGWDNTVALILTNDGHGMRIKSMAHGGGRYFMKSDESPLIAGLLGSAGSAKKTGSAESVSPAELAEAAVNALKSRRVTGEMMKEIADSEFIWMKLVVRGHAVVWVAQPNAGKTTIAIQAAAGITQKGFDVIYYNLDASSDALKDYYAHAEKHGYTLIAPDLLQGYSVESVIKDLEGLADLEGNLGNLVIILDTLKKFCDVINKGSAKKFFTLIRRLTAKGITVLALAHTNKHKDEDGMPVYEGTGDLKADFDELIYFIPYKDEVTGVITVSTLYDKERVFGAENSTFEISRTREVTVLGHYVNTMKLADLEEQLAKDAPVISFINEQINIEKGSITQNKLLEALAAVDPAGITRDKLRKVLAAYTQSQYCAHAIWEIDPAGKNGKHYRRFFQKDGGTKSD